MGISFASFLPKHLTGTRAKPHAQGRKVKAEEVYLSQNFCNSFLPCLGNSCGSVVSGPASAAFGNSVIVQYIVVYFSLCFNLAFKRLGIIIG